MIKVYLFNTLSEGIVEHLIHTLKNKWVTFVTVISFEPILFKHFAVAATIWNIGANFYVRLMDILNYCAKVLLLISAILITTVFCNFPDTSTLSYQLSLLM
jgi:hypothetical protein